MKESRQWWCRLSIVFGSLLFFFCRDEDDSRADLWLSSASLLLCVIPVFLPCPLFLYFFFCVIRLPLVVPLLVPPLAPPTPPPPPQSLLRLFSGFYKARESLVSLPPEIASIVETRDRGLQKRHRGVVAVICWNFPCSWSAGFFPCWTGLQPTDDEQ